LARIAGLVDDYLLAWVLAAVAVGVAVPEAAVVTRFSTPILAVMVGSVSLTLPLSRFRAVDRGGLGVALAGHTVMPFLAFGLARARALSPELTAGFVLLGAVTPELVTPVMTELAGGDTALSSAVLVLAGVASLAYVPGVVGLLVGEVGVDAARIVEGLAIAVVAPMTVAVGARTRYRAIGRYDDYYATVSALMVVLIIGGVAAANADLMRANGDLLAVVVAASLALNAAGYGVGWAATAGRDRPTRIAGALSVGMRDFAVAAALVVAAGFPPVAALPAVAFGVVEMATSAGLARWFAREA
jgi:BASS family bile acid:Na+ symporter